MARTRLFSKLCRTARAVHRARQGESDPSSVLRRYREIGLERRQFLKRMGGGLSLFAMGAVPGCGNDAPSVDTGSRVAIVGGGMAGLHCAYRLKQAGVIATVYEANTRTGGRMFTDRSSFSPQVAELGGEFIDTDHTTLHTLAEEFDIQLDDLDTFFEGEVIDEVWWVDGAAVPEATVVMQFSEVAGVMNDLLIQLDEECDAGVFDLFEELDVISLADWLNDNVPPATYPELHAILSGAYRGEYGLETDEQSVLNLIYLIGADDPDPFRIFGVSDERFHAHTGSQTFVEALAEQLDGQIELDSRLVRASGTGDGPYTLVFEDSSQLQAEVEADRVVFALPFSVLREVALDELELTDDKRMFIDEIGYGTNAKLMGAFTSRVWSVEQNATGSATADVDFQQCWDTAIGQSGDAGLLTLYLGGDRGVAVGTGQPEEHYTAALPQIDALFPGAMAAYEAGSAIRMHWPSFPLTRGSYTCYRPGQWSFFGLEGEAINGLHFCGEHTSLDYQGFMEGAAETGARAAGEVLDALGLAPAAVHQELLSFKRGLPGRERGFLARRRALRQRLTERWRQRQVVS